MKSLSFSSLLTKSFWKESISSPLTKHRLIFTFVQYFYSSQFSIFYISLLVFTVSPLSARITQRERLVANQRHQIECIATGSRPQAMITWWMGSRQLTDVNILVMHFISSSYFFLLYSFSIFFFNSSDFLSLLPSHAQFILFF